MKLNNFTIYEPYSNYPTTFADLDWTNPDIRNPKYFYLLYQAAQERLFKYGIIGSYNKTILDSANFTLPLTYTAFNFEVGNSFKIEYFQILYSAIIASLFNYVNPDRILSAFQYVDNKGIASGKQMNYTKGDVDTILGYSCYELPRYNKDYTYYSKFLIGMKNAIQAMRWIYWPVMVYSEKENAAGESGGIHTENGTTTYENYNWDEVVSDYLASAASAASVSAINASRDYAAFQWLFEKYWIYQNSTLTHTSTHLKVSGPQTVRVKTLCLCPFETDIKFYYYNATSNGKQSIFYDGTDYLYSYFNNDTYNKNALLYETGKTTAMKQSVAADFTITPSFLNPIVIPDFTTHDVVADGTTNKYVYNNIYIGFFSIIDISQGCTWDNIAP